MRRLALGALALSVACARPPEQAIVQLDLRDGWEVRRVGDSSWIPARVPGTVHTDLLQAGLIPDPFIGLSETELQWIEDEAWQYRLIFEVDDAVANHDRQELVFEGLDTYATIELNGHLLLSTDNMFRTWSVDAEEALRPGSNELEITFASPTAVGAARAAEHPWPIPHQEPDEGGTRAFTRKAAYHFGWDWGPRYVTSGIWRPLRLDAWTGVRIRDVRAIPAIDDHGADVELHVELETVESGAVTVGVRSASGAFPSVLATARVEGGLDTVVAVVHIPDPELWWPVGLGEPHLYQVDVDATLGSAWDHQRHRFGLRSIELVTEADTLGETFRFRVNEEDLFVRGANLVPPDHFTPRADSAAYASLLDDALAANMNMVRVWGGGVYLPDVFYDLADQRGVLVWQDFMFANTLVPGDSAFAASVALEARDQVRRLRGHPSIALWCGNNEIAEGWSNWGWRAEYDPETAESVDAAYTQIFGQVLPDILEAHDPSRAYWPSSPRIGWGHPESLTQGDSHYWGVWWGMEPFRTYADKVPRFASEFGFQALPDPATLTAFDTVAPHRLDSPVMQAHEKHPTGFETIGAYLEREWPVPPPDSLDAFAYVSQLAQAEGVGLALEAHRRSWPRTGGTLYWQLNDTWPVVSWSSRDYLGRWKALHYRVRSVFAPVAVLADAWADSVAVWVVSDDESLSGTLEIQVLDMTGTDLGHRSVEVGRSGRAWSATRSSVLPEGVAASGVIVVTTFLRPGAPSLRDVQLLVPPAQLSLPDPGIEVVAVDRGGESWEVTLRSERFAYGVRLSVPGTGASFSDNYMHVLPGESLVVYVQPETAVVDLAARLDIRTLAGVPRN